MLILIAESKTMTTVEQSIEAMTYAESTPLGESLAEKAMQYLSDLSVSEICKVTGFSTNMASKLHNWAYEFPNKSLGYEAIMAYTGVVFKALDFPSMNNEAQDFCKNNVRIISSLYGWLRPFDIIKPYRLDYVMKKFNAESIEFTNSHQPFDSLRKKFCTVCAINEIQQANHKEILNLLPADAAKCIDWKLLRRYAKVYKADFVELKPSPMENKDLLVTPNASKLKTMRGKLLRQILQEGISDIASLKSVASDNYLCEGTPQFPDHLRFLC